MSNVHNGLPFLPETMKLEKVVKTLLPTYIYIKEYFIHIRNLKQALNHGIIFVKVHMFFKFNKEAWLNPCIDMNTKLRKKIKNDFEKKFQVNEYGSFRSNYGEYEKT